MMKIAAVFFMLFLFFSFGEYSLAQDDSESPNVEAPGMPYQRESQTSPEIPPGMELIKMGGIRMIVPQGIKIEKKGSLMTMESSEEFAARSFKEIRDRLDRIERSQEELRQMMEEPRSIVPEARKDSAPSPVGVIEAAPPQ